MSFPKDVKYTKDHEWLRVDGNEAYVGITHFAQSELGDIVFIDVDTEGESLEKEEVFGSVEAVKTVSDLFLPVSGKIIEVNQKIEDSPEIINEDPYNDGWIIKMEIENEEELNELLDAGAYSKLIGL